jgi:hypothetical protein
MFNPPPEPTRLERLLAKLDELTASLHATHCPDADAVYAERQAVLAELASIGYRP